MTAMPRPVPAQQLSSRVHYSRGVDLGLGKERDLYFVCERIFWIRQGVSRKMGGGFSACQEIRKFDNIMDS